MVATGYRTVIGVGVVALVTATLGAVAGPTAKAAGAITFGVPSIVDPVNTVGEPDIGIDRATNVFVSGPAGSGEQRSIWEGSLDGGATFRKIAAIPPSGIDGINNAPGGGDTDIAFDNQTPQKQYFNDLYALAGVRVATTTNEGASISQDVFPGGSAGNPPEVDREWYLVYDPPAGVTSTSPNHTHPLLYMEYGPAPSHWTKSTDGLAFTNATQTTGTGGTPTTHFGADGYPSIDQVTGDVFEAAYSGSTVKINIGTPDANGNLLFRDDTGQPGLITVAPTIINNSGEAANFVVSSIDSARNVYVEWVNRSTTPTQRQVFVSAAPANNATAVNGCTTNCWNNWTTPVQVSDGSSATGDAVNVFPWIKAGGPGMADAVWYGDQSTLNPSSTAAGHVWNVFMDQVVFPTNLSTGSITGAAPSLNLVKVSPHPMDYLDVCLNGTGCAAANPPGNRNLADFFEVNIDKTGAAEVVYDDMSNGLIQQPQPSTTIADHAGAPVITVIRQNGGPGLLGSTVSGPSTAPITGLGDPAGDALSPVIGGTNLPGMDFVGDTSTHLASQLQLSGNTLTVTMHVADLTQLSAAASATNGTILEFVTRWQMGNTIYYAEAFMSGSLSLTSAQFSAGKAQSVDLCSVSLCLPRVITYPEAGTGATGTNTETGSATCPAGPSASKPCTITITVNAADVGSPATSSLLEEVGAYSLTTTHLQFGTTNAQGQLDNVPLEIDGVCCYNFTGNALGPKIPEAPWTPALIAIGMALIGAGVALRRRRRSRLSE